jgi:hypothetical protein
MKKSNIGIMVIPVVAIVIGLYFLFGPEDSQKTIPVHPDPERILRGF